MRIRQVRPEFFTDPLTSKLPVDVRLTYIGLWCVADDAGWLRWDVPEIAALLCPYESIRAREKRVIRAGDALADKGRLDFYECGCAHIPTLTAHQRIGGNKSFTVRDQHEVHTRTDKAGSRKRGRDGDLVVQITPNQEVHTDMDESARNVRLSKGTLVAPASAEALARQRDEADAAEIAAVRARRGLSVARA